MKHRTSTVTIVPTVPRVETCAHFSCIQPATDSRRGMPLCLGHFMVALQWEQPRVSA